MLDVTRSILGLDPNAGCSLLLCLSRTQKAETGLHSALVRLDLIGSLVVDFGVEER